MNSGIISKDEELKQIKNKVDIENLKSNFIFKKILHTMKKNKAFEIIKYNKNIQKRLNLSINDYQQYSQLYSLIEIELKIAYNKYDKFINISGEEMKYYHIYFDNSNEGIKRNHMYDFEHVNKIRIIIDYHVKSFKKLFSGCKCITSVILKKFYRINVTNMSYMFYDCTLLKELTLSNLNTNNINDISGMLFGCSSLNKLNLSNFYTNNVTNMRSMFFGCSSLKELNLSKFNTNNVTNMSDMFYGCSSLNELNISNFNTDKVTNMSNMFYGCSSLKVLDISNFNTNNVKLIDYMFYRCSDELIKKIKEQNKNIKINN